jgi:prevent-host-death family protein
MSGLAMTFTKLTTCGHFWAIWWYQMHGNLVSMTRFTKSKSGPPEKRQRAAAKQRRGYWLLQDAKARFSELVRKVRSEGPQHVTVHGRDEVVVIAADEFRRLKGSMTGEALIEAMQASPYRDVEIAPRRVPMPVRDIPL